MAFDAWLRTAPLTNSSAPATPFATPQFDQASARRATQLGALASTQFTEASDANQRADNYVLMTVLFALVLFFGAIARASNRGALECPHSRSARWSSSRPP